MPCHGNSSISCLFDIIFTKKQRVFVGWMVVNWNKKKTFFLFFEEINWVGNDFQNKETKLWNQ